MSKSGFSLIECMMYCLVMAVIMLFWFNGITLFNRLCAQQTKQINTLSSVYSALDVFSRDLRKAPHDSSLWPLITHTAFIFKCDDSLYIGWESEDGSLVRYQGSYDFHKKQWGKKTKSLVLTMVQDCSFTGNYLNTNIVSMILSITAYGKKYNRISYVNPYRKEYA